MSSQNPDARIANLLRTYADAGVVAVDRRAIAEAAIEQGRRGWRGGVAVRLGFAPRRRALVVLLAALLVAGAVIGLGVGRWFQPDRPLATRSAEPTTPSAKPTLPSVQPSVLATGPMLLLAGPPMSTRRNDPIVVALDGGRVLVAGGRISSDASGGEGPTIDIVDPTTGANAQIIASTPPGSGVGVRLHDGRVFLISLDSSHSCSRAFLVDPALLTSREVTPDGSCSAPFGVHGSMILLDDGRVLVSGGQAEVFPDDASNGAVIFDPTADTFVATGGMTEPRLGHGLAILPDGRVVVAGGEGDPAGAESSFGGVVRTRLGTIEIYDPTARTFSAAGSMEAITGATTAVSLGDGRVLLVPDQRHGIRDAQAGYDNGPTSADGPVPMEIFDPTTGTSRVIGTVPNAVSGAYLLPDGRVFVHGWVLVYAIPNGPGTSYDHAVGWASIIDPATGATVVLPPSRTVLSGSAMLTDGSIVLAGGWSFPPLDALGNGTGGGLFGNSVDIYR